MTADGYFERIFPILLLCEKDFLSLQSLFEAQVAKLVDALLSGGSARNGVSVRL